MKDTFKRPWEGVDGGEPTNEPTIFTLTGHHGKPGEVIKTHNPTNTPTKAVPTLSPISEPTLAPVTHTWSPTGPQVSFAPTSDPTIFPTPEPTPAI